MLEIVAIFHETIYLNIPIGETMTSKECHLSLTNH